MTGGWLREPQARWRWGATVIEVFREDGSIARWVYERPCVRPEPPVELTPVEPLPRTFGDLLALLAGGVVVGVVGWIFVAGLFAVGGAG